MQPLMQPFKSFVRSHPSVYDLVKRIKRRLSRGYDPAYEWFDAFSKSARGVKFVQIGASDGLRNDPIREFIVRDGWEGVLIEPLPGVFEMLRRNYVGCEGLIFLNAAISSEEGSLAFWTFKEDFLSGFSLERRMEYLRKASIDKGHVAKFLEGSPQDVLVQITVPCTTLVNVVQRHLPGGVDLLVIDAEGHEAQILRSIDFDRVRPKAIFFESHHIAAEMLALESLLGAAGYSIRQLGGDCVAEASPNASSGAKDAAAPFNVL